ncbi:MAG TPA: Ig-like domain-containing protein, partial [Candidatus Limnocylindria bacterium]|nr:Ig-like domain-containing protein [Candidatus Limnocylindria bacterium]
DAGSWTEIPALAGDATGPRLGTFSPGTWPAGGTLYILWADDNAGANRDDSGTEEGGYSIDDVFFAAGSSTLPLAVNLTSPASGTAVTPANVLVTANSSGTTPATSVSFYTNDVLFFTDTDAPYSNQLVNLPVGTYSIFAQAVNATETAYSLTNTIVVREQFTSYPGGIISENFDGMTATGTQTPIGWYVGAALPANAVTVTVGDGSAGASGSVLGWNYGTTDDPDRALGTAATGGDRNIVARIQNNTSSNILAFTIRYDGEVWRNYTNAVDGGLTNFVSFDLGATWVPTIFDFDQPAALRVEPQMAVNGNDAANRVAAIGGLVTPPAPVAPGGVIYVRWQDFNGVNVTDGGLAVDNFTFEATAFSEATVNVTITSPTPNQQVPVTCAGDISLTVNATASFFITNVSFQLDGGTPVNDDATPFSATFSSVALGAHTVTALGQDSSGATYTTNVSFTVVPNLAPVVAITNFYTTNLFSISNALSGFVTGNTFTVGTPVISQFSLVDSDSVTNVEVLINGVVRYATNITFGQFVVNDLLLGANTLTIRATDGCGTLGEQSVVITGTNLPAPYTLVVSNGASWKYNALGSEPPLDGSSRAWYEAAYDDATWPSGFAELGGGDAVTSPETNPERTLIDIGPGGNRHHAIYFRHTFSVANPSEFTGLIVSSLADDSSVVYLNGTRIGAFRTTNEFAVAPITYADFGTLDYSDGRLFFSSNAANSLVVGNNTLAVEVHQDSIGSSDLSFDLMLWGEGGGGSVGPRMTIERTDATHANIAWPVTAGAQLQSNTDLNNPGGWVTIPGPYPTVGGNSVVNVTTTGITFYRLHP